MLSLLTKRVLSSGYPTKCGVKNMNMLQMEIFNRTNLNNEPCGNLEGVFFQKLIFQLSPLFTMW